MKSCLDLVGDFHKAHLLVVGDLMLDRFIWGDVERLSPEAPVPVLRMATESSRLGGAANVIHNIRSLGGKATACGIVGRDEAAKRILGELKRVKASSAGVISDRAFETIQKTRIIARPRHQQIVRLDREALGSIRPATLVRLRQWFLKTASRYDGIVISDYGKGVVHAELLDAVAELAGAGEHICVVDPKKENYGHYRWPTLITPNKDEASEASGIVIRDEATLKSAGEKLMRQWRAKAVLITRGPDGMSLFQPRGRVKHFPTQARDMFDVTGAGDTVVAVCALALACGGSYEDAAVLANAAAGLVGDEVGTVAVSLKRLRDNLKERR